MNARCPYCLNAFTDENPQTTDHVFLVSLGGHATIGACSHCNSQTFGSEVEGQLQRPNTVKGFSRHLEGEASKRFEASSTINGQRVEVDLVNDEIRSEDPVTVDRSDPKRIIYTFRGSERQVRENLTGIMRKYALTQGEVDKIIAQAGEMNLGALAVQLTFDVSLAIRSAAKIAIGALVLARGDDSAESRLAGSLRDLAFAKVDPATVPVVRADALDLVREYAANTSAPLNEAASAAVFVDAGNDRTVIFVQLAGELVPPFGLQVSGTMPDSDQIATVIEDAPRKVRIIEVGHVMAVAANALADNDHSDPG